MMYQYLLSAVILACALSLSQVSADILTVTRLDAVEERFGVANGRVGSAWFTCLVFVNATTREGNSTSPPSPQLTLVPRFLDNNQQIGFLFSTSGSDCASGSAADASALSISPLAIPDTLPPGTSAAIFRGTFPFCYRARRIGEDTIPFQCVLNNGMVSPLSRITISVGDGSMIARGLYFGMAPFVFIFVFILMCNVIIWRRMIQRRTQSHARELERIRRAAAGEAFFAANAANGAGGAAGRQTGLSPQAISCIRKETVTAETPDLLKEMCVICQSEFQVDEEYKQLGCNHRFHGECIDAWLAKSTHCPICITDVCLV